MVVRHRVPEGGFDFGGLAGLLVIMLLLGGVLYYWSPEGGTNIASNNAPAAEFAPKSR